MRHWDRYLAALCGLALAANGLAMLFASLDWYEAVPGVTATGPFNGHFVQDIGAIYLVCAAGLVWFAARPREAWPALAAGGAWLTLHAAIHVRDAACTTNPLGALQRDFVGVFLLAAIPLALALIRRPKGAI